MKRIAWASCVFVLLQALTGCCSCCDMNRGSQCYSSCVPADVGTGCCGDGMDYALPPSPYAAYPQRGVQRMRVPRRGLPPVYSTEPYMDMGTSVDDGSMYENFGGEVIQDGVVTPAAPSDSGWQPKPASPMPTPPPMPDNSPSALYVPQPIPAISSARSQVPGPPSPPVTPMPAPSGNFSGPDVGPIMPPTSDPVSQMGYRRAVPIQRAF